MSHPRCAKKYCIKSPQQWLSGYIITITTDGFSLFAKREGSTVLVTQAEPGKVTKIRIPFGAEIVLTNDDSETHTMAGGTLSITVGPGESVLLRSGFRPGDEAPIGEPWSAPLGTLPVSCPIHETEGIPDKRATITIYSDGAFDMGGTSYLYSTDYHPVTAGMTTSLPPNNTTCFTESGGTLISAKRYSGSGVELAVGSDGTDYVFDGDNAVIEILEGNLVTTGPGQYVRVVYDCDNETGCCRTSVSVSGLMRYMAFQRFDGALYPQYKTFRETIEIYDFVAAGNRYPQGSGETPSWGYAPGDTVAGGTRVYERNMKSVRHGTVQRDSYVESGNFCRANLRQIEQNIPDGGYGPADGDQPLKCTNGSIGGEIDREYYTIDGDWVYNTPTNTIVGATSRWCYNYWAFDVCGFDESNEVETITSLKGTTTEEFLNEYSWSDFKADFNALFTEPSALVPDSHDDVWERVQWPNTEYESQWAFYDDTTARLVVNEAGDICDLCEFIDEENTLQSDFDYGDIHLCRNAVITEFDTGVCTDETLDIDCCGEDYYKNGQPASRCDTPVLWEGTGGILWDFVQSPPVPGRVKNNCATNVMNDMPVATPQYVDSPPLHLQPVFLMEAPRSGRFIQVTRVVVKHWWGQPFHREVIENRLVPDPTSQLDGNGVGTSMIETNILWHCEERITDTGSLSPCPWIDDLTQKYERKDNTQLDATWANVDDWHRDIVPGETRMLQATMTCPAYVLVDPDSEEEEPEETEERTNLCPPNLPVYF